MKVALCSCTWNRMCDTMLRLLAFDTWWWRGRVPAARGHGSISAAPLFSSFTLLQRPTGPGEWSSSPTTTCPALITPGVTIQIINALWQKIIILCNFPVSEDELFVPVLFGRFKDQCYGFLQQAHQVYLSFLFFKSRLGLWWYWNCLHLPQKKNPSAIVCVFSHHSLFGWWR